MKPATATSADDQMDVLLNVVQENSSYKTYKYIKQSEIINFLSHVNASLQIKVEFTYDYEITGLFSRPKHQHL